MNKTININLGGIFFHIDEIAYKKLKRYLEAISNSLSDDPKGKEEIIADIESRISELLSERVKDPRQVVSESDIDEIIGIMGQPEDYLVDEEIFNEEDKRSYKKSNYGSTKRKLFRDADDKFLGGVSSGIAYYFDVDVIWIRIAWLIATFGLGFGPLIYIILWILLPEAKTTAEKLQMEGEPVNISNIEKRVRAEFESASDSIRDAVGDVTDAAKGAYDNVSGSFKKKGLKDSKTRSGIQDVIHTLGSILSLFFKIIGKFIGVLLIIIAVGSLLALVIGLFTTGAADFMGADYIFEDGFIFSNNTNLPIWLLSLLGLILIGIPLLMLFFLGLFILSSKSKVLSRTAKMALLGVWLIALLSAIYIGVKQGAEFARGGTVIENNQLLIKPTDTLSVKMIDDEMLSNKNSLHYDSGIRKVIDSNNNTLVYSNNVSVYVKESDSTLYVKVKKEARGRTRLIAKENAQNISYNFSQAGSSILLDGYLLTDEENGFRNQDVSVTLYIPKDQVVYFDKTTKSFLGWATMADKTTRRNMPGHYFKMTSDGLQCLSCPEKMSNNLEKAGLKVDIDSNGLEINVKDVEGDEAKVKIDENGLEITEGN